MQANNYGKALCKILSSKKKTKRKYKHSIKVRILWKKRIKMKEVLISWVCCLEKHTCSHEQYLWTNNTCINLESSAFVLTKHK